MATALPRASNLIRLRGVRDAIDDHLRYLKRFEVTHVVSPVPTPVLIRVVAGYHLHCCGGQSRNRGGKTYSDRRDHSGGVDLHGGRGNGRNLDLQFDSFWNNEAIFGSGVLPGAAGVSGAGVEDWGTAVGDALVSRLFHLAPGGSTSSLL